MTEAMGPQSATLEIAITAAADDTAGGSIPLYYVDDDNRLDIVQRSGAMRVVLKANGDRMSIPVSYRRGDDVRVHVDFAAGRMRVVGKRAPPEDIAANEPARRPGDREPWTIGSKEARAARRRQR